MLATAISKVEKDCPFICDGWQVKRPRQADEHAEISGRERDVSEVRNYWNALLRVVEWARKKKPLSEDLIKRLHALVERGPRAKPTAYRDGQNAIKNSATGALIYLPPEAKDIPDLMASLVD
ncbi:MAG: hypothetical protein WC600_19165 [Desulfobaccales bacterium]